MNSQLYHTGLTIWDHYLTSQWDHVHMKPHIYHIGLTLWDHYVPDLTMRSWWAHMRMNVVECIQWVRNVLHGVETSNTRVKHLSTTRAKHMVRKGLELWCLNVLWVSMNQWIISACTSAASPQRPETLYVIYWAEKVSCNSQLSTVMELFVSAHRRKKQF